MTDRGFSRATKRSAQFPRTPRRTVLTGFGRGARFAIRLRLVERTSFDARVYNQTSSHYKTLFGQSFVGSGRTSYRKSAEQRRRAATYGGCVLMGQCHTAAASPGRKSLPQSALGARTAAQPLRGTQVLHHPRRHPGSYTTQRAGVGASRQYGLECQAYRPLAA